MNKYIIPLILFVTLSVTNVFAQQASLTAQLDSIVALLPQKSGDEKLEALQSLVKLTASLPVQKQQYATMLRDEARKQKNVRYEGKSLAELIWVYFFQFDTDSIFIVGEDAIRFMREHKLYEDLFLIQQNIIMRYGFHGQYLTALRKAEEAYAEARRLQEYMPMARMLSAMGEIYGNMGQNQEAMRCYAESMEAALQNRQESSFFYIENYHNLASHAGVLQLHDEAVRYTDSMQVELERYRQHNPGVDLQDYDYCLYYFYALAYAGLGQTDRLLQAMRKAEELYNPLWNGNYYEVMLDEIYIAHFLATGDYDKAMEHIRHAMRFYEDIRYEAGIMDKITDEAKVHFERGNHKAAAETYRYFIQKKDSLNHQQFYAQINELRTIYELDKAEMEAARQREAVRRQRLINTGLLLACLALILVVSLVWWNRHRIAQKNRGLYRQIREQDRIAEELERERIKYQKLQLRLKTESEIESDENVEGNDAFFFVRLNELMRKKRLFTDSEIKRKDIAVQIGVSDRRLHDCVKSCTGMGFAEYINALRLTFARELLSQQNENLTIETIALDSGFNSRSTLHRLFRSEYGITPEEFRKLSKTEDRKQPVNE